MKKRSNTTLPYLVDLRSILLGFAIFNFSAAWVMNSRIHFTCAACPWYHPWSYLNEPTILLVAALFLRANRWWTNTVALLFSSYLIGYFVHLLLSLDDPIMGPKLRLETHPNVLPLYCRFLGQPISLRADSSFLFRSLT